MKFTKKFLSALMLPIAFQTIYCNAQTILDKELIQKDVSASNSLDYNFFIKKELYNLYEDILEEYTEQKFFSNMKEWEEDKIDILEDFNEVKVYCNNQKCSSILEKLNKLLLACDEDLKGKDNKDTITNLKNEILKELNAL